VKKNVFTSQLAEFAAALVGYLSTEFVFHAVVVFQKIKQFWKGKWLSR